MSERPIIFGAHSVRAILAGQKTQTRRIVTGKVALRWLEPGVFSPTFVAEPENGLCPYGYPGDHLWVREAWALPETYDRENLQLMVNRAAGFSKAREAAAEACSRLAVAQAWLSYKADPTPRPMTGSGPARPGRWRSPVLMPRWASRLTLEVTEVRVQRLQKISEEDAVAEGVPCWVCGGRVDGSSEEDCACFHTKAAAIPSFQVAWDSINGKRGPWESNPWVWAVSFRRHKGGKDGVE